MRRAECLHSGTRAPTVRRPMSTEDDAVEELLAIAARRPEPGWDPFRSRVGADQYRPLHRLIERHVPAGARVLDWGAGLGHLSYVLVRRGYRAVGYALEPCAFAGWMDWDRYAFARGGPSDPVRLPFAESAFDAVVSVGVLEHVREIGGDELASLEEIRRILRPGGAFVCVHFPNRWSWIELAARAAGRRGHPYRFTRRDVGRLVERAGMTLVESFRYGFLPRNVVARFPRPLRASRSLAACWNGVDGALSGALGWLCQNHAFVARKPVGRR
jgi:SAM-dependent methyltransferase